MKYGLHGTLKATNGNGDALSEILIEAAQLLKTSKGCNAYIISRSTTEADAIWVTEVWDSKEAHDASLKQDAIRALIGRAIPLLDGMPERGQELHVVGGFPC